MPAIGCHLASFSARSTVASVRATRISSRNSFAAHHAHPHPHRRSRATLRAAQLKLEKGELPPAVPEDYATNEEFLKALHHVLLEVEIVEGVLVCPETDKRFPIKEGIPSML